jgi:hypothetical protein
MRDVAHVHDGEEIREDVLATSRAAAPQGMKITELFDQWLFVSFNRRCPEGGAHRGLPHLADDLPIRRHPAEHTDHCGDIPLRP